MSFPLQKLRETWVLSKKVAAEDFLMLSLFVLQKDRAYFFQQKDIHLTYFQYRRLNKLLQRRSLHEPVSYLVGNKEFYGRNFSVTKDTLIPRPESECLLEDVLTFEKNSLKPNYILDIGTGSGALIITLAKEFPNSSFKFLANDISSRALKVAKRNAQERRASISFLKGSFLQPYKKVLKRDMRVFIIANLPYVSEKLFQETELDVQKYEPTTALVSKEAGLAHYYALLKEMKEFHGLSGVCWLEISPEQSESLTKHIRNIFPDTSLFVGKDLSERDRFIRFSF